MTTGIIHDQNLEKQIEKQMGCMAGFLQIFDRNQILNGKRLYATKRLPPSPAVDASESGSSEGSPVVVRELEKQEHPGSVPSPDRLKPPVAPEERSPGPEIVTPSNEEAKLPLPLPVFEFKEGTRSSWKFKEAPRLSLDSRATVDAKGSLYPREIRTNAAILSANRFENSAEAAADDGDKQRRSPSVIARLMGLEQLPHSCPEPVKKAELRRSASESRVSKDLLQCRFVDGNNFQLKQSQQSNLGSSISSNVIRDNASIGHRASNGRALDPYPMEYPVRNVKAEPPRALQRGLGSSQWKSPQQRKSFFDSEDFFPEPKQTVSIYGEIERRLKMRGIDEPAKDLETLKQILEALQLKGLLHTKKPTNQFNHRNLVYDLSFPHDESPIVVMKPGRSPASTHRPLRTGKESPPPTSRTKPVVRRNANLSGETMPSVSPRNVRNQARAQNSGSPTRSESSVKSSSSLTTRKALHVEVQRKPIDSTPQLRRVSPVHSPKLSPRRTGPDHTICRSPRNKKPTAEICSPVPVPVEDESSSISEGSISTSSHSDTELQRSKLEGRNLLERCDKLLHSIAEITASELHPSPVSVLDSSFYKDESSPSPVMKRSIDFRELEDEVGSPEASAVELKFEEKPEDCDFIYVSEILQASNYLPEDSDVFLLLEEQQSLKGKDTSKVSRLQRRLIFDTITEIINQKSKLPPWKAISISNSGKSSLQQIWAEFIRIREREASEDLFDIICGVLRKDLAGDAITGWGDCHVEVSEAVLYIERLIFRDLVGETIRDLAAFSGKVRAQAAAAASRRKLVF